MTIDCKALTLLIFAKGVLSFTAAPFYSSCSNDISQSIDSGWKKYKLQGAINSQIDTFLCASGSSSLQKENSTSVETKNQDPSWLEEDLIERPASASAEEPTDASTIDEECDISSMLEDGDEEEDDEEYARLAGGMAESVDLTRENAKLDSLGSYLVVSCLVSTTAFNTVEGLSALVGSSIPTELVVFHDLAMVVASIVTFMGIYATVIFSLCVTVRNNRETTTNCKRLPLVFQASHFPSFYTVRADIDRDESGFFV